MTMRQPNIRNMNVDVCRLARKKNHIVFFSELDITRYVEEFRPQGISATAFSMKTLADLVHDRYLFMTSPFPPWGAEPRGAVDVEFLVEKKIQGRHIPYGYFLRGVEAREYGDLQAEVEEIRGRTESGYLWFASLPGTVRRVVLRFFARHRPWRQKYFGTFSSTEATAAASSMSFKNAWGRRSPVRSCS